MTTHKSVAIRNLDKLMSNVKGGKNSDFGKLLEGSRNNKFDLDNDIGTTIMETKLVEKQDKKQAFRSKLINTNPAEEQIVKQVLVPDTNAGNRLDK